MDMVAYDRDGDGRIQLQANGTPEGDRLCEALHDRRPHLRMALNLVKVVNPEESSDYAAFWHRHSGDQHR